ncbi:general transcription factor II-I repeat domain-containing protein 2B-like [Penaeus chinensis]|uniref:general transcription factor II-I repeat domain-containing protein 2B-like n=1 Tax=Penaeus chinensis TaxID=139456 RepID=UPI001FB6136E|nr:general transcription factor II-I repeat domain-containing protein 2B-like [Penaeus chinensis]
MSAAMERHKLTCYHRWIAKSDWKKRRIAQKNPGPVKPVVKLVNFIRAWGLQHRQFITFLEETDTDYQDLLYHSNVRWIRLGKACQQVWELKQEIISFLELLEKADDFPELSDTDWLCDLAFAVDILTHMNELNVKLQGKDQFVHDMYTNVRACKTKLALFSKLMSNKSFAHFPTLATLKEAPRHVKKFRKSLDDLHGEFYHRFSDFGKIDVTSAGFMSLHTRS